MQATWQGLNAAINRWEATKHRVWLVVGHDPMKGVACDYETERHIKQALASIGRNGYRATAGMELLELYCPLALVNEAADKAAILIGLTERMGVGKEFRRKLREF